jgi:hypothetical protein
MNPLQDDNVSLVKTMNESANEIHSLRVNAPATACQVIDGEAVLIHFDTGQYYSSLGTGGEIIRLLECGHTVDQIVSAFGSRGPSPCEVEMAVRTFVGELVREELFVAGPGGPSDQAAPTLRNGEPFAIPVLHKYVELEDLLKLDPIHDVDPAGWPLRAE